MAVGDAHAFLGFLTPVLTQLSLPSHRLPFSHASAEVRGEKIRRKESSPQPVIELETTPGHKSDTLTTEPPGRGHTVFTRMIQKPVIQ